MDQIDGKRVLSPLRHPYSLEQATGDRGTKAAAERTSANECVRAYTSANPSPTEFCVNSN